MFVILCSIFAVFERRVRWSVAGQQSRNSESTFVCKVGIYYSVQAINTKKNFESTLFNFGITAFRQLVAHHIYAEESYYIEAEEETY